MAVTVQITFDCAEPGRLAEFWAFALGYELEKPPAPFASWDEALEAWGVPETERDSRSAVVDPTGEGPRLFFQRVPEGKTAKNRLHLDVRAAPGKKGEERMEALEARATELVAHGATRVRRYDGEGLDTGSGWVLMTDPEGNEFCLD